MLKVVVLTVTTALFCLAWVLTWMNGDKTEEEVYSKNRIWRCIQEVWYPTFWMFLVHLPSALTALGLFFGSIFLFASVAGDIGIVIGALVGAFAAVVAGRMINILMGGGDSGGAAI